MFVTVTGCCVSEHVLPFYMLCVRATKLLGGVKSD